MVISIVLNLSNRCHDGFYSHTRNYAESAKETIRSEIAQQKYSSRIESTIFSLNNIGFTTILSSPPAILITAFRKVISIFFHICKFFVFSNSLESKLAEKLEDIDRAQVLVGFYKRIQNSFSKEDQHLLENWILKYCQILGSIASKEARILEELDSPAFQTCRFKAQIIEFLNGMDKEIPLQKEAKRIAILYAGLGGGGHKAPAVAIREKLIREKYAVEMIDIDEVEKEFEPKIFGRGHEDIWTEFYQRKGMPALANFMWKLHHWLYFSESRKTAQVIRNKLAAFNPNLIFTVADHKPELASLAYSLNRKMIFVHTDNKFSSKLKEIAQIQTIFSNVLVRFTKPTTAEPISYEKTLPRTQGIRDQLIDLQIPVRQGFKRISSLEQNMLKKEMGVDPSVKVCLIMMGQ